VRKIIIFNLKIKSSYPEQGADYPTDWQSCVESHSTIYGY